MTFDAGKTGTRLCAVVLNWNGADDTIGCLNSLMPDVESGLMAVVVVDNASTDGSSDRLREWIKSASGDLTLIESTANLGYAAGNNLGIELALKNGFEYVWVLNNDTEVCEGSVGEMIGYSDANPGMGIIGSTVTDFISRDTIQCAGGAAYNPLTTIYKPFLAGEKLDRIPPSEEPIAFDYIAGSSMLLRTGMLREIGMLNPDYFLYCEEIDIAARAKRAGYRLGWSRGCVVYHKGGASAGSRSEFVPKKSALAEYHSNLSTLKYTRAFHPGIFPLVFVVRYFLKFSHHLIKGNVDLIPPLTRAYRDFIFKQ